MGRANSIGMGLAALVAFEGCQADWSLRGHVVRIPAASVDAEESSPALGAVPFATIVLRCSGELDRATQADHAGAFELTGSGAGPRLDCVLEATAPGALRWYSAVDAFCADADDANGELAGRCASGAVVARLSPGSESGDEPTQR